MTIILDISYHQGAVDWHALRSAAFATGPKGERLSPVEGVIIKATGEEIGRPFTDPAFKRNWLAARLVAGDDFRIGAYHFQNGAAGTRSGRDEALYFLDILDAAGGMRDNDFLPVLDVEWPVDGSRFQAEQMEEYIETMRDQGKCTPILYGGRWHLEAIPGRDLGQFTKQCPLWLAAYLSNPPAPPKPWDTISLWQFSNKGRVDGISGPVDLNRRLVPIGALIQ